MAASALTFVACGHFAASALIEQQQAKQLQELGGVALRRAENAADYGAATLDRLNLRGPIGCSPSELQAGRLLVYQRSGVKDIRVLSRDGQVMCSAYPETLEFDKRWASRDEMLSARDNMVRIFRVEQFFGDALGVLKDVNDKTSLAAILSIDGSLFDVMPDELRDHSDVSLQLGNGETVVRSRASTDLDVSPENFSVVTTSSERYPIQAIIRIQKSALGSWHHEPYVPILLCSAVLGLAFGALLRKALARGPNLADEIDKALAANEFKPYLQPVFDLRTGAIVGCEILTRWIRADGTVIPPSRFIPIAESTGRIEPMTWQILSTALNELQPLLRQNKRFKISVNIAPHHMLAAGFVDTLRKTVAATRVSARQVVLELTEREEMEDLSRAAAIVAELCSFGFKVAIDDVGIGHSGLSYIQKLGANILKIDKFFVDSICRDPAAKAVVGMLVRLGQELSMTILAEGIEDEAQLAALAAAGVELGQGYLVSPALPIPDFVAFIDKRAQAIEHEPSRDRLIVVA
jgi:sensor c-di-GMP phosphodiesterase-like protein